MARAHDDLQEPLSSFNFALIEIPVPSLAPVAFPIKTGFSIGDKNLVSFQSIQIPDMTIQTRRLQEGNNPFSHTLLMSASQTGQVRIRQAVTPLNVDFYLWFTQAISGISVGAPRRNFIVVHTRQDKLIPRREIFLWDCVPVGWLPSSELNANSSEVCIEELVLECNRVEVLPGIVSD